MSTDSTYNCKTNGINTTGHPTIEEKKRDGGRTIEMHDDKDKPIFYPHGDETNEERILDKLSDGVYRGENDESNLSPDISSKLDLFID